MLVVLVKVLVLVLVLVLMLVLVLVLVLVLMLVLVWTHLESALTQRPQSSVKFIFTVPQKLTKWSLSRVD